MIGAAFRRPRLLAGLALLGLSAFLFVEALRLPYYTPLGPGPGFFPRWLAGILAALSLAVLAEAARRHGGPGEAPSRLAQRRGAVAVGVTAATALLIEPLGFRLTMFLALLVLLPAFGYRRPAVVAAIALVGGFGVFEFFVRFLAVPLPVGGFGL